MLFLALPPADMLPPAGHRARPGRSHGPHRPLRTARRAPRTLPRSGAAAAEAKAARQSSSNSSSSASPRPALSSRPLCRGPGPGGRAGTRPESQCGRNPGLESSGRRGPGVSLSRWRDPRSIVTPTSAPQTSDCIWGARSKSWHSRCSGACIICIHTKARHVQWGSQDGGP